MCRIYHAKTGDYVRLCYRHGARRGERISFFALPVEVSTALLEGQICHVPKGKPAKAPVSFNKRQFVRIDRKECPRCQKCKAPLNRANYQIGLCNCCQEGK